MGRSVVEDEDKEKNKKDDDEGEDEKDEGEGKSKAPFAGAAPPDEPDGAVEPGDEPSEDDGNAKESPTVDALESDWKGATDDGARREIAARVLDGLDKYADFVALTFRLGKSDAENLGRMMDDLSVGEVPVEGALVGKDLPEITPADTLAALKLKTT
jgi:hypothetical protein